MKRLMIAVMMTLCLSLTANAVEVIDAPISTKVGAVFKLACVYSGGVYVYAPEGFNFYQYYACAPKER